MAKNVDDTARGSGCCSASTAIPQKGDKAGAIPVAALSDLWTYSANRIPEISDTVVEIDRAMSLGFNWEMGPFELWDAAGVEATVNAHEETRQADRRQCREAARFGTEILVHRRIQISIRTRSTGN